MTTSPDPVTYLNPALLLPSLLDIGNLAEVGMTLILAVRLKLPLLKMERRARRRKNAASVAPDMAVTLSPLMTMLARLSRTLRTTSLSAASTVTARLATSMILPL
jgi:energy-converting hydrogenase Eha subunit A